MATATTSTKNALINYRNRNAARRLALGFEQPRTGIIRYCSIDLDDDLAWELFEACCYDGISSEGNLVVKFRPTQYQAFLLGNLPTARTLCTVEELEAAAKAWQVNLGQAFENLYFDKAEGKQAHGSEPWWDEPDGYDPDGEPIQVKLGFKNPATVCGRH